MINQPFSPLLLLQHQPPFQPLYKSLFMSCRVFSPGQIKSTNPRYCSCVFSLIEINTYRIWTAYVNATLSFNFILSISELCIWLQACFHWALLLHYYRKVLLVEKSDIIHVQFPCREALTIQIGYLWSFTSLLTAPYYNYLSPCGVWRTPKWRLNISKHFRSLKSNI